ncbi:MAG: DNA-3-methyladenine glycosylase I [Deltaproteobacteria bacterium]|nr:DNA-3-methyladenine glycosylase I [Deltaproteobacteria bacterium]
MPSRSASRKRSSGRLRQKRRCGWAAGSDLMVRYHDEEWGVPSHDDRHLFEMLILEGAQAGLSWRTILEKRAGYRRAFSRFNPRLIARYGPSDRARLLRDPGIVRNRLKIASTITNARAFLDVTREFGSFDAYIWRFTAGRPIRKVRRMLRQVPAKTPEAEAMSQDLKARSFRFVGPTICYAFMQAVGMADDHLTDCFRHRPIAGRKAPRRNRKPSKKFLLKR